MLLDKVMETMMEKEDWEDSVVNVFGDRSLEKLETLENGVGVMYHSYHHYQGCPMSYQVDTPSRDIVVVRI